MASAVKPGLFVQADDETRVVPFTRGSASDKTIRSFFGFEL